MTTLFDSDVRIRRNHTPWATMRVQAFMKEMAYNIFQGDKRDAIENRVILECHYRHQVASSFWWTITWTGEDGQRHSAEAQELDLCLWRAAEIEMRIRRKIEQKKSSLSQDESTAESPAVQT